MGAVGIKRKWVLLAIFALVFTAVYAAYNSMINTSQGITEIVWQRTGCFAGLDETLIIKSDGSAYMSSNIQGEMEFTLSESEWADLTTIIIDSDILKIDESYEPKSDVSDFFSYRMLIESDSKSTHIEWVDDWASKEDLPEGLVDIGEHMLTIIQGLENE